MLLYFIPLAIAFGVAYFACPLAIKQANRIGFADHPDCVRKQHNESIPLGGGIVILFAVVVATSLTIWYAWKSGDIQQLKLGEEAVRQFIAMALAASIIVGVGIVDDRLGMRGLHKLLGQTCAALVLMLGGLHFQGFEFAGVSFELGFVGLILTLFWILGAINAINLIDGADGVAATIGIGIFGSLGAVAFLSPHVPAAIIPMATAGALLAFLVYNFPPAKMYLGDSGSMLIGLIAAGSAIHGMAKSPATFAIASPVALLALLAIPIMDTSFAIFRRKLTGRSIYDTDRGHLHHCLLDRGISPRQLVFVVAGLSCVTSLGAVASIWIGMDLLSLLAVVVILGGLARWRLFGHGELALLWTTLVKVVRRVRHSMWADSVVQIQGTREWTRLWEMVVDFAKHREMVAMQLTLNMPWLHEAVHANWGNTDSLGDHSCWQLNIPLAVEAKQAGWLRVVGRGREEMVQTTPVLFEFIRDLESEMAKIAGLEEIPVHVRPHKLPTPIIIRTGASSELDSVYT